MCCLNAGVAGGVHGNLLRRSLGMLGLEAMMLITHGTNTLDLNPQKARGCWRRLLFDRLTAVSPIDLSIMGY